MSNQRFLVSWEIDIYADSPKQAAERAFAIMQRQGTLANYFTVTDKDGVKTEVDLEEEKS